MIDVDSRVYVICYSIELTTSVSNVLWRRCTKGRTFIGNSAACRQLPLARISLHFSYCFRSGEMLILARMQIWMLPYTYAYHACNAANQ